MKYLKSFNENVDELPTYDDDYLKDSKKKLTLINGISKLLKELNTDGIYFTQDHRPTYNNTKMNSLIYTPRKKWNITYEDRTSITGESWVSILELSYDELKDILSYLIKYNKSVGDLAQSITDKAFKKINQ